MVKRRQAHGQDGVIKFVQCMKKENPLVLDIGSGDKLHYNYMKEHGINVKSNDIYGEVDYLGDYNTLNFSTLFDGIHAAHVLEHQLNVNSFLKKIHSDLVEGGWLCITVPPLKSQIVSGHISLWNMGLLLYNLVLANFNCKNAIGKLYGYNISVILKKETIVLPELAYDWPDLVTLNEFFPVNLQYRPQDKSFNGDIKSLNW